MTSQADLAAIEEYAALLHAAEHQAVAKTKPVVVRACFNIKRSCQQRAAGHPHLPFYPAAFSYDTAVAGSTITGEVGPDKAKKQGPLGNIAEFGTGTHGPVLPVLGPATEEELPRYEQALLDAIASVYEP